jgi:hypothetical protein
MCETQVSTSVSDLTDWKEVALLYAQNTEYYRSILDKCVLVMGHDPFSDHGRFFYSDLPRLISERLNKLDT